MSTFKWMGINNQGKRTVGYVDAADVKAAHIELKKMGIEVISLEVRTKINLSRFNFLSRKGKIKPKDILIFTRYLSTMLSAGLTIVQALDIISHDQDNAAMQSLVINIKTNIAEGKTLGESLRKYPKYFGELYCNLIKSGEKSGTLDKSLIRLGNYIERSENLKRKVKKALVYPAAILTVAMIVSLVLLLFVVPQFQKMFETFGAQLPMFTRMVVSLSNFLRSYWWIILIAAGLGIWLLKRYWRQSESFRNKVDQWSLKIYIIGPLLKKSIISRFTRTLATTLESGMPIVESMNAMAQIMGNKIYSNAVLKVCNEVVSGHQLSTSMAATNLFPNMAIQMIAVGEASGKLSDMLNKVADYYEDDVNAIVDNLSSLLEPLIMLILGVIVGGFVVAMYLPIFKLGSLF